MQSKWFLEIQMNQSEKGEETDTEKEAEEEDKEGEEEGDPHHFVSLSPKQEDEN